MFPVLGQLEGGEKKQISQIWETQDSRGQNGDANLLPDYETLCSLPPPTHCTPSSLRKGSFCSWEYSQQLPQSGLGTCKRERAGIYLEAGSYERA